MNDFLTVRQVPARLFGDIGGSDPASFYDTFSAPGSTRRIELGDDLYDHIEDRLGCDVEDEARALRRFVHPPGYRGNAAPIDGTMQGNATEVVSFIVASLDGFSPTRIVSYERGSGADDFPQPDFIVQKDGEVGALEVKSTQALDYNRLRVVRDPGFDSWRRLAPCRRTAPARQRALRQLGYVDDIPREQSHMLREHGGRIVPFPSSFGIAHVHLVRDARLDSMRHHPRLKVPTLCRSAGRNCWSCLDAPRPGSAQTSPAHLTLVDFRNAPKVLVMHEASSSGWLTKYRRWSEALWARDPVATGPLQSKLAARIEQWLEELPNAADLRPHLRGWWDWYLGGVARANGMSEVAASPRFELPELIFRRREQEEFEPRMPEVAEIQAQELPGWARLRGEADWSARFGEADSHVVTAQHGVLLIRHLPKEWWEGVEVTQERATEIAKSMVRTLFAVSSDIVVSSVQLGSGLRELNASDDDKSSFLGWRYLPDGDRPTDILVHGDFPFALASPATIALSLRDPRCALGVHADGRAYLRVPRVMLAAPPIIVRT